MEYIVGVKTVIEFQKLLNQWKHTYELEFIRVEFAQISEVNYARYVIKRTKKEK